MSTLSEGQDRERSREISGEGKGKGGGKGKHCLNEGTETPRSQEGKLTKCSDAETRGSGGHLSPTGKQCLLVPEVPRSSPRSGQVPHIGGHKICY